jgi:hypothetical protein
LGAGGGQILQNGIIIVNSAPSLPFYSAGTFYGYSNLLFISGTLGGLFNFNNVNFSGAAAKQINGTTNITGIIVADIPVGANGLISIVGGELVVMGTFKVSQTMTISSAPGAKLNVPGTLDFEGSVSTSVTVLGTAYISTLNVGGGNFILNDDVTIGLAKVAGGATITMIGANTVNRVFSDVAGAGTLSIQGGTNTFHTMSSINNVILSGGILNADTRQCSIISFTQSGGTIQGMATLSCSTATLSNAQVVNTPVTATSLYLAGFSTLNGGSLTVVNLGVVSQNSQLTLGMGAVFTVLANAQVSQSYPLQILPSGTSQIPSFINNGKWTSTSSLSLDILTSGSGSFQFGTGGSVSVTGIKFTINSLLLTSATFTSIGSTVLINSVDGSGSTINSQSQSWVVNGTMNVGTFNHQNGITNIVTGNIGTLSVQTGTFNVTGNGIKVGTLNFQGGTITSHSQAVNIATTTTMITTNNPKTISAVTIETDGLTMSCGAQQCQLIMINAQITTN